MNLSPLTAVSPVDGRYRKQLSELADYFSEYALIKYRVRIEIEYFVALSQSGVPQLAPMGEALENQLRNIYKNFSEQDAQIVKEIEAVKNHDVKAVEYFVRDKLSEIGLSEKLEFVHFGLTSQDINNTAIPLLLKECIQALILPFLQQILAQLDQYAHTWKGVAMLARTHGQPASPTSLGKEIKVFVNRLEEQFKYVEATIYAAKFGGATGNFNAHKVAYPEIDWPAFANKFVNKQLGLYRSQFTTQIEHYDHLAALLDTFKRINTILIDLNRDVWYYISLEYFKQKINVNEVGSSAMPHKVNPIDFENSEGNLGIANALFEFLSSKLPVSRLQRDLTDSTILRNLGVPLAHSLLAYKSLLKGLQKLQLNEHALQSDLQKHWAVVAEAIQTILRREGFKEPYELLKTLTRTHSEITEQAIKDFIDSLEVSDSIKQELHAISPFNYIGHASEF